MTTLHTTPAAAIEPARFSGAVSRLLAARIAGVSYVALFTLAIFANFMVVEGLVVDGDGAATLANVRESIGLFRWGLVAFLAVFLIDVVVSWALHIVFRPIAADLSLVTAWFRLVYTVFLGAGLVSFFEAMQIANGVSGLSDDAAAAQTLLAMGSFEAMWLIGLAAFGIHLVLLGILVNRSGLVTRALGFILMAAGVAYTADTVAHAVLADYESVAGIMLALVAVPSMLGEGWLGLWLLRARRITD
jgi:hypothetical protein